MAALQKVRAIGMIKGSLLADAATMGLHWIYDQKVIAEKLTSGAEPSFFDPPSCPFYTYDQGKYSPYGDEVVPFLNAVSSSREFDADAISALNYEFFKSYSGRLNSCTKKFIENRDAGNPWHECHVEHHEAQGIIKVPLLVARYGGTAELLDRVDDAVNIIQNSPQSQHASKLLAVILERVLLTGDTPADAIRWASNDDQSSRLSSEAAKLLNIVLNEPLLHAWSQFNVALGEGMELFPRMMLSGKLFAAVIQTLDLQSAFATVEMSDVEREHVERARQTMHAIDTVTLQQEVAALGLSCGLPGI
jgi:hypothetical protein